MGEKQKRKFQSVVLGALLHDVGKFMQRAELEKEFPEIKENYDEFCPTGDSGRPAYLHAAHTAFFIERFIPDGLFDKTELYNAARHHKNPTGDIYKEADRLSSGSEREKGTKDIGDRDNYKKSRMHSVLEYMTIASNNMTTPGYRYELDPLDDNVENCFPTKLNFLNPCEGEKIVNSYRRLWDGFIKDLEIIDASNMNNFVISILSLLEKYTWCIPSSTVDRPDISLFDHSKTTAAIASTLYLYHSAAGDLDTARISLADETKKFTLLAGDISGIQRYIFDIKNVGVGGTAKMLRARSFFLSVLSDIAAHKLLHEFDLTVSNLIISSGGKFYLLLPYIKGSSIMEDMKLVFDSWCVNNLNGEVAVNIASVDFSCKELLHFDVLFKKVNIKLQEQKSSPFKSYLVEEREWKESNFIFDDVGFEDEESLCASCRKFSGIKRQDQDVVLCEHCNNDVKLGRQLTKAVRIQLFHDTAGKFNVFDYSFSVLLEKEKVSKDAYMIYQINDWSFKGKPTALRPKYFANHVPVFDEALCRYCDKHDCKEKEYATAGNPKFFTCLAHASRGQKALGVLKADVDNLGLIFIDGFRFEEKAISRVTTLSRQLDFFFTGRLDSLLRQEFQDVYTVYAGGDDILVLGPWSQVLKLGVRLREEFTEYCCGNPDFTLSAGMTVCKPRLPIYAAIDSADGLLEKAKHQSALGEDNPKDQLAVLGDSFKWGKAKSLLNEAEKLAGWQEEKKISMGFVRLLLSCAEMYRYFRLTGETRRLRFAPLLAYSITRNINTKEQALISWMQDMMDINDSKLNNLTFLSNYSISINRR